MSDFSLIPSGTSIFEDYAPSPLNPSPIFTDSQFAGTSLSFNDTAGIRNDGQVANGQGYSFTYNGGSSASYLNIYVGAYDVTAELTASNSSGSVLGAVTATGPAPLNGTINNGGSWTVGASNGDYGVYSLYVPADLGTVTFDYLATGNGGSSVANVSIFAASAYSVPGSSAPVPLPASAGVGFSMLGGFGALTMLRKRFGRGSVID